MQKHHEHQNSIASHLTISQVAHQTGVSAKAIRYYESIGLLPRPSRGPNHYRHYSMADVNRLILLHRIRCMGVQLTSAKPLLIGASDARCIEVQQELLQLVNARLAALDQEIVELHLVHDEIVSFQQKLTDGHPNNSDVFRTCVDMSCIAISDKIEEERRNLREHL